MGIFSYDPLAALNNCENLMGMELKPCGQNKLCGGYYINGDVHLWRRDKLKVYIWRGGVFVSEEGGQTMSLPNWLVQYGGAKDFKDALRMIKGQSQALDWNHQVRQMRQREIKYVSPDMLIAAKRYDLRKSNLYRWFCGIFPEEKVIEAFDRYNVTVDGQGLSVFWVLDKDGRCLHDKRIKYMENGHRDKSFGGTRQFKTADGYTGRAFFGSHLIPDDGSDILVVESEKSALALYMVTGATVVATAGKNNLKEFDKRFLLYPDIDAAEEWIQTGNRVMEWWNFSQGRIPLGPTDDICDLIEKAPSYGCGIVKNKWWR